MREFYFRVRNNFGAAHWAAQWERWKTEREMLVLIFEGRFRG